MSSPANHHPRCDAARDAHSNLPPLSQRRAPRWRSKDLTAVAPRLARLGAASCATAPPSSAFCRWPLGAPTNLSAEAETWNAAGWRFEAWCRAQDLSTTTPAASTPSLATPRTRKPRARLRGGRRHKSRDAGRAREAATARKSGCGGPERHTHALNRAPCNRHARWTPARVTWRRALAEAQIGARRAAVRARVLFAWYAAPDPHFYVQGELKS